MSAPHTGIYVSLVSAVEVLKSMIQEAALQAAHRERNPYPRADWMEFDYHPFMTALVGEIFTQDPAVFALGKVLPSTHILLAAGLQPESAALIAHRVFQVTLDCITTAVPGLSFTEPEGVQCAFVEGDTLMINVHNPTLMDPTELVSPEDR